MNIGFTKFQNEHIPLWQKWVEKPHVKEVWFIEGYETPNYIYQKINGNGYDYPFVIYLDSVPIGYVVCCDLYAYRMKCPAPKGLFTNENPGTFCMDLFIGEENYLNRGYGTKIVQAFIQYVFRNFNAQVLLIDPGVANQRAIRCYEKAGFQFVEIAHDGITDAYVMKVEKEQFLP